MTAAEEPTQVDSDTIDEPWDTDASEALELLEPDPAPESVSYKGSEFDVEGLVRRLNRRDIIIPSFGHDYEDIETARFQREFVWSRPQMDRFIESLLLGYPIPGIFLVQQADRRYLVLDGQQRLRTLQAFYTGIHDKREFRLQNVGDEFKGLTYDRLDAEQRRILDNTFIQATIVQTDGSGHSLDAVYQVFERLNSGGTQLTPHEIRVALYAGPFVDYITELNATPAWRALYGGRPQRLRDEELVLRVVALYVAPGAYKRPLKKFLNDFVGAHRFLDGFNSELVRNRFTGAAQLLFEGPGGAALRYKSPQVNAALAEATLVGLMRRLDLGTAPEPASVSSAVDELLGEESLMAAISRATADEESVRVRLAVATKTLANT